MARISQKIFFSEEQCIAMAAIDLDFADAFDLRLVDGWRKIAALINVAAAKAVDAEWALLAEHSRRYAVILDEVQAQANKATEEVKVFDKKGYMCPNCASQDLVWDATARWDVGKQDFVLSGTQDTVTCQNCERDFTDPEEVEETDDGN